MTRQPSQTRSQREVMQFLEVMPIKPAHNFFVNGADMILECYMLWGLDFRSLAPFLFFRAPLVPTLDFGSGMSERMEDAYRFERKLLQNLQWRRPSRHWVLKDPAHHLYLPELFSVFPDATVIWPHRDPVDLFASSIALGVAMTSGFARRQVDKREVAHALLQSYRAGLDRILDNPIIDSPRVVHVLYAELTGDPVVLAERVYDRVGRPFTAAAADNIRAYRADPNNRPDLYGRFDYSLEGSGLTEADIRAAFRDYVERFAIAPGGGASRSSRD